MTIDQISLDEVRAGDVVEVVGHRVADAPRSGRVLEVHRTSPRPSFRVEWEDGHVSLLYPGSDIVISRSHRT
jgi:Domain of unknown function (DUF1918)